MKIIKDIEQGTDEWLELRRGKITGSRLKDVVVKRGTKKKKAFWELIAERLAVPEDGDEKPMDRGHRLEDEVIELFETETGKLVEQVGFIVSDFNDHVAISPDGIIANDKGKYTEAIEIKCLNTASYLEAYFTDTVPSEYWMQVLQYFIVMDELETLHFVMYEPRVPSHPMKIFEITRDEVADEVQLYKDYQINELAEVEEYVNQLTF